MSFSAINLRRQRFIPWDAAEDRRKEKGHWAVRTPLASARQRGAGRPPRGICLVPGKAPFLGTRIAEVQPMRFSILWSWCLRDNLPCFAHKNPMAPWLGRWNPTAGPPSASGVEREDQPPKLFSWQKWQKLKLPYFCIQVYRIVSTFMCIYICTYT